MNNNTIAGIEPALTAEQVERFWQDGFLVIDDVLTDARLQQLRSACDEIGANRKLDGYQTNTLHALGLCARHPAFLELARGPELVPRLTPLLGPDIQIQHSKLATKPPTKNAGPFAWHQDFAYFPHTNTDLVAVMVMLDDATPDNGCMRMVRGSHRLGLLNHTVNGLFSAACQESRYWEDESAVADITPRAGGISLHHCLTLHGSPLNRSGKPRRGLVIQYRADDAYQLADGIWEDTGILVCGKRRERVRCDAGTVRLPKSRRYGAGSPFGAAWNQDGPLASQRNYMDPPE